MSFLIRDGKCAFYTDEETGEPVIRELSFSRLAAFECSRLLQWGLHVCILECLLLSCFRGYSQIELGCLHASLCRQWGRLLALSPTDASIAVLCEQPTQDDYENDLTKHQLVMEFDMNVWKVGALLSIGTELRTKPSLSHSVRLRCSISGNR